MQMIKVRRNVSWHRLGSTLKIEEVKGMEKKRRKKTASIKKQSNPVNVKPGMLVVFDMR